MEAVQNKVKAFPIYMADSGCGYHRIRLPFIHGHELYAHEHIKQVEVAKLMEYYESSEVLVMNRTFPLGLDRLREIKDKGVKIVVDLDDWPELPSYHPNYLEYKNGAAKLIYETLKIADLVTVTTDRLRENISEYNNRIEVIPNALPFGLGQFRPHPAPAPREGKPFTFIYTGQSSHLEDVRLMQPAVKQAARMEDIAFTLAGYKELPPHAPHKYRRVWPDIEAVFAQSPRYTRVLSRPLETYMMAYDDADCSVVPLCVNAFNFCKSNLKLLEAAAKKLPCIVSWVPPYRDDADAPVLWVKSPGDWIKHMRFLADNRNAAREMGEALHDWAVERFNLGYWNKVRFQLYESLVR